MKIKKTLLLILFVVSISLSLSACSKNNTTDTESTAKSEQKTESKSSADENSEDDSVGKVENLEFGKRTTLKSNKEINIEQTQGPIKAKITDIQMSKLETNENGKSLFNGKDTVYFVTIAMEVENTSTDTISIYPDQGTLVTDTKEQVEANLLLSESKLGGEYIGNVIKKGNVIFIIDSNPEEINNIKFTFNAPHNSNFENVGGDFMYELSIK